MSAAKRKRDEVNNSINFVYLIILGLLFAYPLFQQGLWFDYDWNPYQVVVGICVLAFFILRKKQSVVSLEPIDVAGIAFVIIYGLSTLVAADANIASQQALKTVSYLILFGLVVQSLSSINEVQTLLRIFYWTGFTVVFYSMGAAFGTFTYDGALWDGRVYSILEYPNIFACYTLVMLLLGLYLGERVDKVPWQAVYAFGNYFILVGFFAAESRGAFLTMGAALLIYMFGLGRLRLKIIPQLIVFAASGYLFSEKVFNPAVEHAPLYYWGILIIASIPSLLTVLLNKLDTSKKLFENTKIRLAVMAIMIIGINMNVFGNRIFDFSGNANINVSERIVFYQDAVKIIKDYPILGTGGGGWESLYRKYQGYGYLTSQVHNHYLQVWIETGIIGFLAYLGIWISAVFLAVRLLRRGNPENRFLTWTLLCAVLVIGIHSFADFSLSMPAIMILLWGLLGCLRIMPVIDKVPGMLRDKLTFNWNAKPVMITIAGIFIIISALQVTAQRVWSICRRKIFPRPVLISSWLLSLTHLQVFIGLVWVKASCLSAVTIMTRSC